jgi:hypothetical protein
MFSHDEFRELSALAAIGQLSSDEDGELNAHLRGCTDCREAHADYARVVRHELPQVDSIRWRVKSAISTPPADAQVRDRFLARARAEGIDISISAEKSANVPAARASRWLSPKRLIWGLATACAVALLVASLSRKYEVVPRLIETNSAQGQAGPEALALTVGLADLQRTLNLKTAELERLGAEKSVSDESLRTLQQEIAEAKSQVDGLSAALKQTEAANAGLTGANQLKDATIANLHAQNDKLASESADHLAERVILETQVRDLTATLQEETANVERERQLSAVAQDVRRLMGARNLHIIDVHDVDGGGKSAKSFGRVFYAQDQSLIFYAFDLPSGKLTPAKYTFQAWGQREYVSGSVRNLGTFEVDDHEQRRWVLKVNDPALLRDIDSVFVTAESPTDAKEPHGRKLLYAYIVGQPNHP